MSLTAPPVDPRAPLPPAVVILGNDAQLAARPATPVQLAHAALALGFRAVIPASWGDELIAAASLRIIAARGMRPAIHCACPHVARRLLGVGTELAPHLVSLVAPPVAAAKYLRLHAPQGLRVTYVGRCPAAADDSIDARLTPGEFLAQLAERGIDPREQPEVFESVIPPDRRRHDSLPGGLPSPDELWRQTGLRAETLAGDDLAIEIAERVLARAESVLDAAPALGCSCAGVLEGGAPEGARAAVIALEPPRALLPVVDEARALTLELPVPVAARAAAALLDDAAPQSSGRRAAPPEIVVSPAASPAPPGEPPLGSEAPPAEAAREPVRRPRLTPPGSPTIVLAPLHGEPPPAAPFTPRRRPPPPTPRVVPGPLPVASEPGGRLLPRAYGARRRSPRGGVPVVNDDAPRPTPAAAAAPGAAADAAAPVDTERPIERSVEPVTRPEGEGAPPPAVATPVAHLAPPVAGPLERSLTFVSANPRAAIVAALVAVVMLIGVAIGYAAARRGGGAQSEASGAASGQLRVDSSAASAAPSLTTPARSPASSTGTRGAAAAPRTPARRGAAGPRAVGGRGGTPARPAESPPSVGEAAAPPPTAAAPLEASPVPGAATPPADSAAIRARRDSAAVAARATARADSLTSEREAIRREIERRRARIDSILRAQGASGGGGGTPP